MRNIRKVSLRGSHPRKRRVWGDAMERKSGKCGYENAENAENASDWLECDWFRRPPNDRDKNKVFMTYSYCDRE